MNQIRRSLIANRIYRPLGEDGLGESLHSFARLAAEIHKESR